MNDEKIISFLKVIARRKNLQKWLICVSWCMLIATAIAFIINTTAIFFPIYNAVLYGFVVILIGFLSSFVYIIVRRTSVYEAARYADSAGLKERLITSIEHIGSNDGFAGLLKEDTVREIDSFDKKLRLPLAYPFKRYILAFILLCMFNICIFVPSQAKKDAQNMHKLAMKAKEVEEKAEKAMEILENTELEKAEAAKLKKILEDAKKELAEAKTESDIKKANERLKSKLKQELAEANNEKLMKAIQPLVPETNLAKMADFNKKLAEMANDAGIDKELVNELKSVAESLTSEQMEELLKKLEEAMSDGAVTSSEVASALSSVDSRDAQMASAAITAASSSSPNPSASSVPSSGSSPNPSASTAPSNGGSSGSGNGNGSGSGNGAGNGVKGGGGNNSGTGKGAGWNMGNSQGLLRKEEEGKGEVVYLTDKEQGNDANLTGKKNGEAKITQKSSKQGGAFAGSKADLDTVIGDYSSEAYAKVNSNKVPSAMKDIVKEYFSGFGE